MRKILAEIKALESKIAGYDKDTLAKTVWEFWEATHPKKTKQKPEKVLELGIKYRDKIDRIAEGSSNNQIDSKEHKKLMMLMKHLERAIKQKRDIRMVAYELAISFGQSQVPQKEDIYGYSSLKKSDVVYFRTPNGVDAGIVERGREIQSGGDLDSFGFGINNQIYVSGLKDGKDAGFRVYLDNLIAPYNVPGKAKLDKSLEKIKAISDSRAPLLKEVAHRLENAIQKAIGSYDDKDEKASISENQVSRHYRNHDFMRSYGEHDMYNPDFVGKQKVIETVKKTLSDLKGIKEVYAGNSEKGWFYVNVVVE